MKRSRFRRPLAIWWWCVALATVATFGLSLATFPSYLATPGQDQLTLAILLDSFYRTLQLFVLTWETLPRSIPCPLLVALYQLFREQVELLLLRRSRDHVIVCGLGARGIELVHDLCKQGRQVVVIEG